MIHIIIREERRKPPRELALVMSADVYDAKGILLKSNPSQLHTMGESVADIASPQILYAAEWDGRSPWVTVLKGDLATIKMAYAGWPMVTKEEWVAANPESLL